MCEQREQLIGYLYEEGDAAERAAVRAHLDECADCRAEIAGFRTVQEDLRAWEVPDHESVWRPFTPVAAPAWWQQVPSWALAAAAGLVLASGATGGAVAYLLAPQPAPVMVQQTAPAPILQNTSAVTSEELAAAEQRVMERVRLQFAAFETQFSASSDRTLLASSPGVPGDDARLRQIEQQIGELRLKTDEQLGIAARINANLTIHETKFNTKFGQLSDRIKGVADLVGSK